MNNISEKLIFEWISWIKNEKRLSTKTILSYRIDINSIFDFLGSYVNEEINLNIVEKLDDDDLSAWFYNRLKKGISHRSNARALSSLKSFLSFLVLRKKIKNSKILKIRGPKFLESLPRPLSESQIMKIIAEIKNEKIKWIKMRNLSAVILMWGYGLRISEVINLKLMEIINDELRILGKGNKIRVIPISTELVKFITKMIGECPFNLESDGYIFIGKKGRKLKPEIIQRLIREIRKKIFLPDNTTPHSFRHSFATELLSNFADLRSIQELLGHTSLSTTQKYTSVNTDHIRKILEKSHPRSD